jgi:hypothetical protein
MRKMTNLRRRKMATRHRTSPTKASESVVARMAAKTLGVPAFDFVSEVVEAWRADEVGTLSTPLMRDDVVFYEWTADVPSQVMSDKLGHLTEHVIMHDLGVVFLVKDSIRSGAAGLWLVYGGLPKPSDTHRGMFNHFKIDGEWVRITAIQLETCTRQL